MRCISGLCTTALKRIDRRAGFAYKVFKSIPAEIVPPYVVLIEVN